MKPIIKKLSLLLAVALTAACGDMKLQTDADYDHSVLDPHIPMTAWEYFETVSYTHLTLPTKIAV